MVRNGVFSRKESSFGSLAWMDAEHYEKKMQCKENFMQNSGRTETLRPVHQYENGIRCCCQREVLKWQQEEEADPSDLLKMWLECSTTSPIILSSVRRAASTLGMSHASVQRMLRTNGWHPYKARVVQKLHDEDYANRIEFACDELDRIADPMHLKVLIFSDEANFYLDRDAN